MRPPHTRQPAGQSVIEYALLFGLLLVVIVSILVITGPGIGNVYYQVLETGRGKRPVAGSPAGETERTADATGCGSITILGDIRFNLPLQSNGDSGAGTFLLGGKSNCSLVIGSSAGTSDPLVFEPTRYPPRIDCVEIDDLVVGRDLFADLSRTYFSLEPAPLELRITNGAGGPALLTATFQPDHLIVEKSAIVVRGGLAGVRVEDSIASPTLAAFAGAEKVTFQMVIHPRAADDGTSQIDLTLDRSALYARSALFVLTLNAECN